MVNDLRQLLHETSDAPPIDAHDLTWVVHAGRRRVRRRRWSAVGGTALATAAVVGASTVALGTFGSPPDLSAAGVPNPVGPVLRLTQAVPAVEGDDYRVVASHTNDNLDADNGQYLDGLTDDGLVLFRDGPRMDQLFPRYALMDPETGDKDWLPDPDVGQVDLHPIELGADRLVLLGADGGRSETTDGGTVELTAHVFDRDDRRWSTIDWTGLPEVEGPWGARIAPDGRLYVPVPATRGTPPPGGWPVGPDGDAEDADAEGDTFDLWSVSLVDSEDVRDEGLRVGAFAFTGESLVWTDRTNGDAGMLHVRDLASGEETELDPELGERCNLLSFGATDERVVLGQYCGTYEGGVRDDRVQVITTSGDPVATIQGSGVEGGLASGAGGEGLVSVTSYHRATGGTYVYDLADGSFARVSDAVSSWATGGLTPPGHVMWNTPVNRNKGATEVLAEWLR